MMTIEFYIKLFVISADSLAPFVLPLIGDRNLEIVKHMARDEITRFMSSGKNYYMNVNSSEINQSEAEKRFYHAVLGLEGGQQIAREMSSIIGKCSAKDAEYQEAKERLRSIAARYSNLEIENLLVTPSQKLQEIALNLAVHELYPLNTEYVSVRDEIDSAMPASAWDEWVLGADLFDGIDDVVKRAAGQIAEGSDAIRFVQAWKNFLPKSEFEVVFEYLIEEARAELVDTNRALFEIIIGMLKI